MTIKNLRKKNDLAHRFFDEEYEYLTSKQKSIINKNLTSTEEKLIKISNILDEQYLNTLSTGKF